MIKFWMPYHPHISVNTVWRWQKNRVYLNQYVRVFREEMYYLTRGLEPFLSAEVSVSIRITPPDKRKRDIDNMLKSILDAIQYCELIKNDSQVKKLFVEMLPANKESSGLDIEIKLV